MRKETGTGNRTDNGMRGAAGDGMRNAAGNETDNRIRGGIYTWLLCGMVLALTACGVPWDADGGAWDAGDGTRDRAGDAVIEDADAGTESEGILQTENVPAGDEGLPGETGSGGDGNIPAEQESPREVSQGGRAGTIYLTLPEDWECELCPDEGLRSGEYGIRFWPADAPEGVVELGYQDFFGVCGTGLAMEKITLAGDPATVGIYDGHGYWDYVSWRESKKGIVALMYVDEEWWSEYGEQVRAILDTLRFDTSVAEPIGLTLKISDVTPTGATLIFEQNGGSPTGDLHFGEQWTLEQWTPERPETVEGETGWEEVTPAEPGDYMIRMVAYMIPLGETASQELDWEWLYGELPAGMYRIGKEVDDWRGLGDWDTYRLYVTFLIETPRE
ncbi:MAG: hypothetical protein NC079_10490 [Clostridium sp.]|nr:hypothetical protein [Acetatifactor muris]MCM1527913.1 hypothetical protein [Bacteroides sp.]MCM1564021.1 hypothetical protein [Clostridium sp.]